MGTKVKSSAASRKGRKVSANKVNNVVTAAVSVVSAPAGAGVGSGAAAPAVGVVAAGSAGGGVRSSAGRSDSASQFVAAAIRECEDIKVIELRQKIARNWAAPEWSGAAALRASLLALGTLSEDQVNAAVAGAARKSEEDLSAVTPSLEEVCEYISNNFASEFRAVCGCAVPGAAAVRSYSYTNLSLATITADSDINDYVVTSAVPDGLSASGLVGVVMSVRVLADVRKRLAAARSAARADLFAAAAGVARMALRLGVGADVIGRYMSLKMSAVAVADDSEIKRLRKNLASCWSALRACEVSLVLAAPAGAFGAIEDGCGGFVFPAALPASAPAKCRKLWAKRVRLLSDIATLSALLARC